MIDPQQIKKLKHTVWSHYKKHARDDLPWRHTQDPYHILVSEVMLQQTQVVRVIEKYHSFLKQFPTVRALALAPLRDVLIAWQGLGYNRRGKMLHNSAQMILETYGGHVPRAYDALRTLPGVGTYTAGAVCAFAYNTPVPILETNIRTVLFHHLYGLRTDVTDAELMHVSALLLDPKRSREWYYALMDYGAYLKSQRVQLNTKSKHYTKQKKFEGSDRQVRGALLRALTKLGPVDEQALITMTNETPTRVRTHLSALHKEGMVVHQADGRWTL